MTQMPTPDVRLAQLARRRLLAGGAGSFLLGLLTACSSSSDADVPGSASLQSPSQTPTSSTDSAPSTSAAPTTSATTATPDPLPAGLVNVLAIGSDTRDESGFTGRSDAIIVVQLNPERTHINLVSIPRDVTSGGSKINAAYARGGTSRLAEQVSATLGGIPIHLTVETTFGRFIAIMELLGGVTVQNRIASHSFGPAFPAGPLYINGDAALSYNRERKGLPNGDLDRTERHRATLTGIVAKVHEVYTTMPEKMQSLVPGLYENVRVRDLSLEQAMALLDFAPRLTEASVTSVMLPISGFSSTGGFSDVVDQVQTAELVAALNTGDLTGYVATYGTGTDLTG
ncbi:MAG: LCP family protein [Actinomycetales bacterium]